MFLDFPKRHSIVIQIHTKSYFLLMTFHLPKTIINRESFTAILTTIPLNFTSIFGFSNSSFNHILRTTKDTRNFFILLFYYFFGFHLFSDDWNLRVLRNPLNYFV